MVRFVGTESMLSWQTIQSGTMMLLLSSHVQVFSLFSEVDSFCTSLSVYVRCIKASYTLFQINIFTMGTNWLQVAVFRHTARQRKL